MGKLYDKEFKLQTIRIILDEGKPVAQAAREQGINENTVTAKIESTENAN
jgi:transposase